VLNAYAPGRLVHAPVQENYHLGAFLVQQVTSKVIERIVAMNNEPSWEVIRYHFMRLTPLDKGIRWWLLLFTKLAEVFLIWSTVWAGLLLRWPDLPTHYVWLDGFTTLIQNIAVDMAGPGMFVVAKYAQQEGDQSRRKLSIGIGIVFIVLAILTLSTSTLASAFGVKESAWPVWIAILLIFRVIASILYVVICEVSQKDEQDSSVVRSVDVLARMNEIGTDMQARIRLQETETERRLHQVEVSVVQQVQRITETIQQNNAFQQQQLLKLMSPSQMSETGFQQYLAESLSPIIETLNLYAQTLTLLPELTEQLGQFGEQTQYQIRTVTEEVTQVKVTLDQQANALPMLAERLLAQRTVTDMPEQRVARAKTPLQLPVKRSDGGTFDRERFVFTCLEEDPEMKIAEIQQRAEKMKQSISVGSISTYRKSFQNRHEMKVIESDSETSNDFQDQEEVG